MILTDEELINELTTRLAQSRKAFSDLSVVNLKLIEMNRMLELSEALKSNFLSNIRNEINNPLNAIIGLGSQLVEMAQCGGDLSSLATMICSEAINLDFQLRNIFVAAELEAGEIDPHAARVNVAAVVSDVVESFSHCAIRKSVNIELELFQNDASPLFTTDAEKLQVIVSNLLANAVEYSPEGGIVSISTKIDADGWLELTVKDHGPGIDLAQQRHIFDRFVQLETGATRPHPGQGLGLSIVKALTDLLQGTITLHSIPGEGTRFTVALPAISDVEEESVFADGGNLFIFDEISEK
ncbi:MAG: histidine kinase [Geobacter sp.]|nr:MAG: histidine kinase [Geobacter sp.]